MTDLFKYEERIVSEEEKQHSQIVRIFDVFIFATILLLAGIYGKLTIPLRIILIILAAITIFYNAIYYVKYKKENQITNK